MWKRRRCITAPNRSYSAYAAPGSEEEGALQAQAVYRCTSQRKARGRRATAATDRGEPDPGEPDRRDSCNRNCDTAAGTTTALANTPAVEKPGKKEKIRFGQAPREALPPAAHPTNGSEEANGQGAGNEAQVASNSSSTDIPNGEAAAPVERKTRFHDRAKEPKAKKAKTADQLENERVTQPVTSEEAAAQKTQSAPLGLAGDTAAKKKAVR